MTPSISLPLASRSSVPDGFGVIPHGVGYLIVNNGPDVICPITVFGFPVFNAKNVGGVRGQWILKGEAILADQWAPEPTAATRSTLRALLAGALDLDYIARPRMAAVLRNFGSGRTGDYAWINDRQNRKAWLGETPPPADGFHYDSLNAIGAEGWNNAHYDLGFWCLVNWVINGDSGAYQTGLRYLVGQATCGFIWGGPERGQYRYEKGYDSVGQTLNAGLHPAREKEWDRSVVLAWHVTHMPIFRLMLEMRRDYLRSIPANYWGGEWGARNPGRVLDNMLCLEEGMGYQMGDRAEAMVRHVMTLVDPVKGYWMNRGNGGTAPTSPWMNAELCHAVKCWIDRRPSLSDLMPKVQAIAERIAADGINRTHAFPLCWYRFPGHPESAGNQNFGLAGFLLPMLRWSDPKLAEEIKDTTSTYIGALVSQADQGFIPPISDIRCNYGPQGSAFYKLMLEALHGGRVR